MFRGRPRWASFARILSVGAVACALAAIANLTTILVPAELRSHGTATVAAYGIAARLITAYCVVTASGVRPGIWRAR